MAAPGQRSVTVGPAAPEVWRRAVSLVYGRTSKFNRAARVQTALEGLRTGDIPAEGLWAAQRQGRLVGAVFWQVQVGKTALLWPPQLVPGEEADTAGRLLDAALEQLQARDVRLAHALLEPDCPADAGLLLQAGFFHLADLLYLVSWERDFPDADPAPTLQFESYGSANHERFKQVIEATYQQSRDCPDLDGLRDIEDVLAGYRATGAFRPSLWLLARCADQDVGCLLLADHPADGNYELVYMGLVPSARGNGWGRQIARYAQWRARQAGRSRVVLAVDAKNQPARRIYIELGFQPWDCRRVYTKVFADLPR